MPETVIIQGTPIQFPTSSDEPNWAPPVSQFATLVAQALSGVIGPNDISPQVYTMVSNTNTNVSIPGLQFATSQVRSANIRYSVYRTTNSANAAEAGNIVMVYNVNSPVNQKWEWTLTRAGDGDITFVVLDTGQLEFSTTALAGSNHAGFISFAAQALQQT